MIKMVRKTGILVFALLIGLSAHSIYKMYRSGELFEDYNSKRKASITLLSVSMLALGALGSIELREIGKQSRRRGYGDRHWHYREENLHRIEGKSAANIYASREVVDPWHGRKIRSSKAKYKPMREMHEIWMNVLRMFSVVLPVGYLGICTLVCLRGGHYGLEPWVLPTLFSCLTLVSLFMAVGIFCKKGWGLSLGYLMAVLNLVIFPYGTVAGLLLLIGLVGAAPAFANNAPKARKSAHSAAI